MLDNIEYRDDFIEGSSTSELSDIPEEVEEEVLEEAKNQGPPPSKLSPQLLNGHTPLSKVRHIACEPSVHFLLMHYGTKNLLVDVVWW